MTQPTYMTLKRQALVLQEIAKEIAEKDSIYSMIESSCDSAIQMVEQCSADLIAKLKESKLAARNFKHLNRNHPPKSSEKSEAPSTAAPTAD